MVAFVAFIAMPYSASAERYDAGSSRSYYVNENVNAQIQALLRQVAALQAELARITGNSSNCYSAGRYDYCYRPGTNWSSTGDLRSIDVDYKNSAAYVTVEWKNGREREYIVGGADTDTEVITALASLLDLPRAEVAAAIRFSGDWDDEDEDDWNDDDIDSIRVTIDRDDDEAEARVRYEDGDTDTFDYNTDVKSDIIEQLADDLNIDEDDVEDLIDWDYNDSGSNEEDIDSIDATIYEDDERTNVRVEFDDGSVRFFNYDTDDEDEVVEDLADDLDVDEDEVEDLIDFDYRD
jgi:energy-converting hydrogenase A subunit M